MPYTFQQLTDMLPEVLPDSVISRTVYQDERLKLTLFGFAAGQGLTEHSSSKAAIIHILQGEATLSLEDEVRHVSAGSWFFLSPNLKHSLSASSDMQMLLTMLK